MKRTIHNVHRICGRLAVAAALLSGAMSLHADTWYVSTTGDDGNDGSSEAPFKTIQKALDLGLDTLGGDDEIVVRPGTYHLGGSALVKNLYCTLRSESGNPADTIIDADGDSYCARFVGAEGVRKKIPFRVSGFTFMNGRMRYSSSVQCCGVVAEVNVFISNCVVTACGSVDNAYFPVELRDATMVDCVISNCTVAQAASALRLNENGVFRDGRITGCRVANGVYGAVLAYKGGKLLNTIVSNNVGVTTGALSGVPEELSGCLFVSNRITYSSSSIRSCGMVTIATNGTDIANLPASTLVTNCVIANNLADNAANVICLGLRIDGVACRAVGCTITNNASRSSTGVCARSDDGADVELVNCLIANNTAVTTSGGGAYLGDGVVARNCSFIGNHAEIQSGGGVYAMGCILDGCVFSNNVAKSGAGVCVVTNGAGVVAQIGNCRFIDNSATYAGGGLRVGYIDGTANPDHTGRSDGYAVVTNCVFVRNSAAAQSSASGAYDGGGAVALRTGDVSAGFFDRCIFMTNSTAGYGGAFTVRTSASSSHGKADIIVRNSLFAGNRATAGNKKYGGAMYLTSGDPVFVENCTFSGNEDAALNSGSNGNDDICVRWSGIRVRNCIFATPRFESNTAYSTTLETNCFVGASIPTSVSANRGNFAVPDAKFANAANGDFSLCQDSPCVNVAALFDWMTPRSSLDLAGNRRISSQGPDLGAYECQIPVGTMMVVR